MKCDVRRPTYARRAREPDMRHADMRRATRDMRDVRDVTTANARTGRACARRRSRLGLRRRPPAARRAPAP
ncbi:hypothetical protein AQ859_19270, partial [Burkholderia pseudomallei]